MRKRVLILPIIMVVCLIATIYVANTSTQSTQSSQSSQGVEVKMPEKIMEAPKMKYPVSVEQARAASVTPTPTPEPTPTPDPTPEPEEVTEEIIEVVVVEEPIYEEPVYEEPYVEEELPTPADEYAYVDQTFLGAYTITWYSREAVGYDAPGASENGLIPYYSCAMPDYSLLDHTILVEGYGIFHVDDVSDGVCDLYVMYDSEIPSYGMDYANVYLLD